MLNAEFSTSQCFLTQYFLRRFSATYSEENLYENYLKRSYDNEKIQNYYINIHRADFLQSQQTQRI